MIKIDEYIGERIKKVRKHVKVTQAAVADHIGVNRSYISKIEKNKSKPSIQFIKSFCNSFGIKEDWLTSGAGGSEIGFKFDGNSELAKELMFEEMDASYKLSREQLLGMLNDCIKELDAVNELFFTIHMSNFIFDRDDIDTKILIKRLGDELTAASEYFETLKFNK